MSQAMSQTNQKDSAVGGVSAEWPIRTLRHELRRIEQGWSPECENRSAEDGEWGVLKVGCVNYGRFRDSENKALPPGVLPLTEFEVRDGDVLISRANTRELVGSAALVEETRPRLLMSDKLFRLHYRHDRVDPRFLVFLLQSNVCRLQLERDATGASSSMLNVGQDSIRRLRFAWPPLDEQKALATLLRGRLPKLDVLIAKKEQLIFLLAEKRQALITERVAGGNENARGRRKTRLAWIIREVQRPVVVEPEVRYAEIGVRSHGRGTFHKSPVFGWELDEKKVYWVEPGDLVFNIVFAWERAVAVVKEADRGRIASHRFPTYRAIDGAADMRFLRYLFMSDLGRFLLDQNSPGAAGRNRTLDRSSLLKEEVHVPDLEAQRRIANELDAAISSLDRSHAALREQLERLREYRNVLITAAVTGQLDVALATPTVRATSHYAEAE